ncbi:MAG: hypothetical protein ACREU7_03290, partial [Burkholderiales bacterium]
MNPILLHLLASTGYAALAVYHWRSLRRLGAAPSAARFAVVHLLPALPLVVHCIVLSQSMLRADGLYLGVGNAVSVIIALAVLIYGIGNLFYRLEALHVLILPAAALLSLLPLAFAPLGPLGNTHLLAFRVHLLIALLSYSLLTIASF